MELAWLGTAAFKIVVEDAVILLDPYLSRSERARPIVPLKARDITEADYIFLSHGHFDHTYDVPEIAARTGARVFASSQVCDWLHEAGLPSHQLRPVQGVEAMGLGSFGVRTIPSAHVRFDLPLILRTLPRAAWQVLRNLSLFTRYPSGPVMGYLFTTRRYSWCFFGSAGYRLEYIAGMEPDLALVPVQGRTDICRRAAEMVAHLAPRWAIPHHYDNFFPPFSRMIDLAPFLAEVKRLAPATRVHIPQVGQVMTYERGELV